ncbi:MAG: hypothetical protein CSA36_00625 [Draconibacterium sp.]|nr:MAG: hypothetical protein CSA36_00625 [Draconibacterium sp.]
MEALTNFFLDKNCLKVLDVGTGTGNFTIQLRSAFPDAEITGVDPSEEALTKARERFPDILFMVGEAEHLPFKAGSFDAVAISMALHHLTKVSKGLHEIKRVVKNEGWIIIYEPVSDNLNKAQEVHKLHHHFRSRIDRILGISHQKTFPKNQIIQMVENAGITIRLHFEHTEKTKNPEVLEIEKWMEKMEQQLEKIKGRPEYEEMKRQIPEIREKTIVNGFQPVTKLVLIGQKE